MSVVAVVVNQSTHYMPHKNALNLRSYDIQRRTLHVSKYSSFQIRSYNTIKQKKPN